MYFKNERTITRSNYIKGRNSKGCVYINYGFCTRDWNHHWMYLQRRVKTCNLLISSFRIARLLALDSSPQILFTNCSDFSLCSALLESFLFHLSDIGETYFTLFRRHYIFYTWSIEVIEFCSEFYWITWISCK